MKIPARMASSDEHRPLPSSSADCLSLSTGVKNCSERLGYVSRVPTIQGTRLAQNGLTGSSTYAVTHSLCEGLAQENATQGTTCYQDPQNKQKGASSKACLSLGMGDT